MKQKPLAFLLFLAGCSGASTPTPAPVPSEPPPPAPPGELLAPEAFAQMADPEARSKALFMEAAKVLTHPRCVNCHPHDDQPRQRDRAEAHNPPVVRGPDNHGVPALACGSCHQDRNLDHARVPGAPDWHLAPIEMAWLGRTPAAICAQIKDPKRNGGKTLAQIADHTAHDKLVGWGWNPGADRQPAPGSQERFGALVAAWIETGAACPAEEKPQ
ncbi:hypothetical protein [Chondromyces apiculatus]|uniref:Putative Isoquinoline 1-oxidoreductase n=1 Tax=Chondromyces apiculatus DSM 436 TaxID=1192034 RepID=A0A017T2C8_9BACT|nr:hypothetical protein [Chondromyces apiculatus]EYF03419.1 Putative Isoquinoline 1-oxidoreductase [Chondromyces apiculatus DSM 436]